MIDGDQWIGFRANQSGTFNAVLEGAATQSVLELYTAQFTPLVVGPGMTSLSAPIREDEIYVLHAAGESPLGLNIVVTKDEDPVSAAFLDINADTLVTAVDALLIINHLNRQGSGPAGELTHLDADRDGNIAPLDALLVINYLNRQLSSGDAEGESAGLPSDTGRAIALEASLETRWDESSRPVTRQHAPVKRRLHEPHSRKVNQRWRPDSSSVAAQPLFFAEPASHFERHRAAREFHHLERERSNAALEDELEDALCDIADEVDQWWQKNS